MWTARLAALLLLSGAGACGEPVEDQAPVGSDQPSEVELERFARRLHLDLTGGVPDDAEIQSTVGELEEAAGGSSARGELADELMAGEDFARNWVAELENRVFAGDDYGDRFALLCGNARQNDPACQSCAAAQDPCADCDCPRVAELRSEREALEEASADFAGGASTSAIERRFAEAGAFAEFQAPQQTAALLFETFLRRPIEPDELENVERIIVGLRIAPQNPSGLLFQRHVSDDGELMDVFFEAEVYREAAVDGVFERYLGRAASPAELSHFAGELDPEDADVRPVIRAAVSSREYFEQ